MAAAGKRLMKVDLSGLVAVITGGASGFGRAVATRFAQSGAAVVIADVQEQALATVRQEITSAGGRCSARQANVINPADVQALGESVLAEHGRWDILVNCAGVMGPKKFVDCDVETWDRVMNINLRGTFLCGQAAGRAMVKQGSGVIVNIASTGAFGAIPNIGPDYHASKAGVVSLTQVMALELAPAVRVIALAPGMAITPLTLPGLGPPEAQERRLARIPLRRFNTPDDVAGLILFLVSDDASYITGTTIDLDGGLLAQC